MSKNPRHVTRPLSEILALAAVDRVGSASASAVANSVTAFGASRSTAYLALDNLAADGLLAKTYGATPGGAPRVTYTATPAARSALRPFRDLLKGPDAENEAETEDHGT